MLGGPAVRANFALAANFEATKLPVAPLSMRMTAGREPTNPASLMSALLGGVAHLGTSTIGLVLVATMECRSRFDKLRIALCFDGVSSISLSSEATEANRWFWLAAADTREEGPGSWPESGRFSCPSSEKRFDVAIFSAGLTEKTASQFHCPWGNHASSDLSACSGSNVLRRAASRYRWL